MANRYLITGGGSVTWDASNTAIWSASSGGATGASVPVDGDAVIMDGASGGGTVTLGYDPTVTSITMGAFTGTFTVGAYNPTMQTFSCTGTGTRTLNMGSGTWTITGSGTTIWTTSTATNLTLNAGTSIVNCTYSDGTGTRTFTSGSSVRLYDVKFSAGTDIVNFNGSGVSLFCHSLDFTGFTGTCTQTAAAPNFTGDLTLGAGMTWTTNTGTISFTGTSGIQTITSNGVQINQPITINGVGGTVRLADALNMDGASARTLTLTNGTFDANGFNVTCGIFSSSNSNTRTLTMGSGTWTITGSGTTIFTCSTVTNLTLNFDTSTVNCTYSGSVGTRTINLGNASSVTSGSVYNLNITAGSDTVNLTASGSVNIRGDLNFTGFTGTLTTGTSNYYGNVTYGVGMTGPSTTATTTYKATSGPKTITTNGVAINTPITFDGVGGSWTLQDSLDMSGAGTRTLTLTQGTFDANNKNITAGAFASTNSNTRTLTMGTGTWTLTGTGTVWNASTSTNLTLYGQTSTIKVTDSSATNITFAGGGMSYANLWFARGTSTASNTISGSNTFNQFKDDGSVAHSILFTAGTTQTILLWSVSGTAGNEITINSTTTGTHTLRTHPGIVQSGDYLNIQHSLAEPAFAWYAGYNSTDNQTDATAGDGWIFTTPPRRGGGGSSVSFAYLKRWDGYKWVPARLKMGSRDVELMVYQNTWKSVDTNGDN